MSKMLDVFVVVIDTLNSKHNNYVQCMYSRAKFPSREIQMFPFYDMSGILPNTNKNQKNMSLSSNIIIFIIAKLVWGNKNTCIVPLCESKRSYPKPFRLCFFVIRNVYLIYLCFLKYGTAKICHQYLRCMFYIYTCAAICSCKKISRFHVEANPKIDQCIVQFQIEFNFIWLYRYLLLYFPLNF